MHQQDSRDPPTTQTNSVSEPGQYIFSGFHNYFCQQQNTGGSSGVQDLQNIVVMVLSAPVLTSSFIPHPTLVHVAFYSQPTSI